MQSIHMYINHTIVTVIAVTAAIVNVISVTPNSTPFQYTLTHTHIRRNYISTMHIYTSVCWCVQNIYVIRFDCLNFEL